MAEKIYNCKKCKYSTTDKRDYTKHMTTKKHMRKVGKIKKLFRQHALIRCLYVQSVINPINIGSGLSRHLKKCDFDEDDEFEVVPKKKKQKKARKSMAY